MIITQLFLILAPRKLCCTEAPISGQTECFITVVEQIYNNLLRPNTTSFVFFDFFCFVPDNGTHTLAFQHARVLIYIKCINFDYTNGIQVTIDYRRHSIKFFLGSDLKSYKLVTFLNLSSVSSVYMLIYIKLYKKNNYKCLPKYTCMKSIMRSC